MKRRALAVVLTLMMIVSVLPMAAFAAKFTDTDGHWGESSIDRWTDAGVLQGMGDGTFAPDKTLTRAEAAALYTRLLKLDQTTDISNFTDVEAGSWYEQYVSYAVAAKIMNGTSATTFNPLGTISRQDFFLVLTRVMQIPGQSTCNYTGFEDLDQLSDYARDAVYALINLDYVHGRSATELAPLAPITRASAAKVLDNVIKYYITESGTYTVDGTAGVLVVGDNLNVKLQTPDGKAYGGTVAVWGDNSSASQGGTTPSGGGGGGGGGYTPPVSTYKLEVKLQAAGLKTDADAVLLSADVATDSTVKYAMNQLIGTDANKTRATNAIEGIMEKFTGDYDTDDYCVSIQKTNAGDYVLIVVDLSKVGPDEDILSAVDARVDLAPFVAEQVDLFNAKIDRLAAKGITGVTSETLKDVKSAFTPARLFRETASVDNGAQLQGDEIKMLTYLTPDGYYSLLKEMIGALANLQNDMLQVNATAEDFTEVFSTEGIFKLTLDESMTTALTTKNSPLSKLVGKTSVLMNETIASGTAKEIAVAAAGVIDDVFSRDFSNDPIAMAILEAAANKGVLDGAYKLSLTVVS